MAVEPTERKPPRSGPRKPRAPVTPVEAALRLVAFRARTSKELELGLKKRGYTPEETSAALVRVRELGYLDDDHFAHERAQGLLRQGKLGGRAVLQKLRAHGLSESLAKAALRKAEETLGFDPTAAARALLQKRGLLGRPLSVAERAKAARFLMSRGFSSEVLERLLSQRALSSDGQDG